MRRESTTTADLLEVIGLFDSIGCRYWLDGGWGVDALFGRQTREHRDVDIDFDATCLEAVLRTLTERGYAMDTDELPVRAELYSDELGYLDAHPFELLGDGTSRQADPEGGWYEFVPDYFGFTEFLGRRVPCISLLGQEAFHSGYELRDKDRHDIELLRALREGRRGMA